MKTITLVALAVGLYSCASAPYWLLKADHMSNPTAGAPFNNDCEATADFIGAGIGTTIERERSATDIEVAFGKKRIGQCGAVERSRRSAAGELEIRHRIPMR